MSTERNYAPRASCASPTDSTANSTAKTPLSLDERERFIATAQAQLCDLVDEYFKIGEVSEPIEVINNLLHLWLTTPATNIALLTANQDALTTAFQLVNFLAQAYEANTRLQIELDQAKKESASNGDK